ncbi:MAG: hypothetical protein JRJ02_06905 [Deltaproteobacteria bacterium]|nr:hypothetical protein [Deltaproteobacteria bacterium]
MSAIAMKWAWTHRFILFFDDLIYGKKPKIKKVPDSYNDYMIPEEDYWKLADKIAGSDDGVTKKTMR